MASPEKTPNQFYLPVQKQLDRELATLLKDAAREAAKIVDDLAGDASVGAAIRRRQFAAIRVQLLKTSESLWGGVTTAMRRNMLKAVQAANESMAYADRFLFNALDFDASEYQRAMMLQYTRTVDTFLARSVSGRPLSEQVYRTKALSDGLVDRAVNRGLLLGKSAREIAKDVRLLIRPDVPGGPSYAAYRLGRTELNNAFHQTTIDRRGREPWVEGMKWNLSASHPKNDDCDAYAETAWIPGGDAGVFRPQEVPGKPHPNCLCFLTAVTVGVDAFLDGVLRGDYAEFMRDEIAGAEPSTLSGSMSPLA